MVTAADLQAHYGEDEFAGIEDDHLDLAILRAVATIGRYLTPAQQDDAGATLTPVVLTLARAYAHDEQALPPEHPVVREMAEALRWLQSQYDRLAARTDAAAKRGHVGVTVYRSPEARVSDLAGMLP
jgi:FMN phosphatase YigB (HAD superfamily)